MAHKPLTHRSLGKTGKILVRNRTSRRSASTALKALDKYSLGMNLCIDRLLFWRNSAQGVAEAVHPAGTGRWVAALPCVAGPRKTRQYFTSQSIFIKLRANNTEGLERVLPCYEFMDWQIAILAIFRTRRRRGRVPRPLWTTGGRTSCCVAGTGKTRQYFTSQPILTKFRVNRQRPWARIPLLRIYGLIERYFG